MVHQVMPSSERSLTFLTTEWLFSFMNQYMCLQLVGVWELRLAYLTFVWLLSSMNTKMSSQVSNLNELSIAMCTVIGFFTRMETHVSFKMMISCKSLVANLALKRFFTGVCAFMVLKYMLISKATITYLACENFVPAIISRRTATTTLRWAVGSTISSPGTRTSRKQIAYPQRYWRGRCVGRYDTRANLGVMGLVRSRWCLCWSMMMGMIRMTSWEQIFGRTNTNKIWR